MQRAGHSLAHNATNWLRPRYSEGIGALALVPIHRLRNFVMGPDLVAQDESFEDWEMRAPMTP